MPVFPFHTSPVLLYYFLETKHRNNVNPSLFIQVAKVQLQNE